MFKDHKKSFFTGFLLLAIFYSFTLGEGKFRWLQGTWEMKGSGTQCKQEIWEVANGNSLSGKGIELNGTQQQILESIELIYKDDAYWYIPTVPGQNNDQPVAFKLTEESGLKFTFEKSDHDFPNRIIYHYKPLNAVVVDPPMPGDTLDIRVESLAGEGFELRFFRK